MRDSGQLNEAGYEIYDYLMVDDVILSSAYLKSSEGVMIVIDHPAIFNLDFPYKKYCQKQNEWMTDFGKVYRFIEGDQELVKLIGNLVVEESDYYTGRTFNREALSMDPTPVEYRFEECFEEAYGNDAFKYVSREYSFVTNEGRTAYMDYALFKKDGTWVAIEENGICYHHPAIIKEIKYRVILSKQNSVIQQNGIVFRWDTESLSNQERIVDELKEFVGDLNDYVVQYSMKTHRGFVLHDHQTDYLTHLKNDRVSGVKSALVVLPTGTGKTLIALEDMKALSEENGKLNGLVLSPTIDLVNQWKREINAYKPHLGEIKCLTYASSTRNYYLDSPYTYDYIVVDEAHHGVAPVLKKVIYHYQPEFMLGLTATDKRLDAQKLGSVFGEYEEKLDLKQAIEKGLLCQIRSFRLETNIDLSEVRFNGKDYLSAQLERCISVASRNELISDILFEYFYSRLPGKSGIVFCVSVAHAKEMARLLRQRGFTAESIDGKDKHRQQKVDAYMNHDIQFLCTCSLLNEGWDAPHTSVIVMARPTLSKVLYTQQLGRGTRNQSGKEALYVIDVVDAYGSFGTVSNRPWSVHSLFGLYTYRPFGNLFERQIDTGEELVLLNTTYEQVIKLQPYDLFTMQKTYEDFLSAEQLARELFISTGTLNNWIRKGEIEADVSIPMGRSKIMMFHPDKIVKVRVLKGLKPHTEATIVEDFWAFIDEKTYTFSYKMYFILALLEVVDSTGDADINDLMQRYRHYYLERFEKGLIVDRDNCPYNIRAYIMEDRTLIRSILENPFEKFERKRFMYYAKDLSKISIHHKVWDDLTRNDGIKKLKVRMIEDLKDYYSGFEEKPK